MLVAEVIFSLPLDKVFHYAVPNEFAGRLVSGMRVLVIWQAQRIRRIGGSCVRNGGGFILKIPH